MAEKSIRRLIKLQVGRNHPRSSANMMRRNSSKVTRPSLSSSASRKSATASAGVPPTPSRCGIAVFESAEAYQRKIYHDLSHL